MIARDLWNPIVTEIIFCGRVLAVVSLEETDEISRHIMPKTGWLCLLGQIITERLFGAIAARHRQVAGKNIVECWNVGRTLDRCVTAQRQDAAARPPDVA